MNWEEVKRKFDKISFPNDISENDIREKHYGEYHIFSSDYREKAIHTLQRFQKEDKFHDYNVLYAWQWCPECKVIWNKYATLFNEEGNIAYSRHWVRKGKAVNEY